MVALHAAEVIVESDLADGVHGVVGEQFLT